MSAGTVIWPPASAVLISSVVLLDGHTGMYGHEAVLARLILEIMFPYSGSRLALYFFSAVATTHDRCEKVLRGSVAFVQVERPGPFAHASGLK